MASGNKDTTNMFGAGVAGFSAAAILALLLSKSASGSQPSEGTVLFKPDEDTWNLLMGILDGIVDGNAKLDAILMALGGAVKNPSGTISQTILLPFAGTGVNLPPYIIPYDKEIVIKALNDPAFHANIGTIMVGSSKVGSENISSAYPLLPGEAVGYKVRNSDCLWVCPTIAGDGVSWTVEQE